MSEKLQTNYLDDLPEGLRDEIEAVAKEKRMNKEERSKLEEVIKKMYLSRRFEPGEVIGIIGAQSISEPATQMSADFDEKIITKHDDKINAVKIGEFCDDIISKYGFEKINNSEVYDLPVNINYFVLSLDQDEKVKWKRIISCIRHKSPEKMLKITTKSGRGIICTDHHSFVIRKNNKIVPVSGKELKVNDRVPVIKYLPENCTEFLNINDVVSLSGYCIKDGFVRSIHPNFKPIPEKIKLDKLFGWLVGAYLSEGNATKSYVNISNIDENFLSNARNFAKHLGMGYRERDYKGEYGPSHSFMISSSLLSRIMINLSNTGSENKKVPEFAYSAREEFVSGLLRGYFDGDGNVSVSRKMIRVHSNSEELIDGIKLLLTRFGIFAHKKKDNKKQFYLLIPYKYAPIFLEKIGSDIKEKKERLEKLSNLSKNFWEGKSQDFTDMISGFGDIFYRIAKRLKYPTRYVNNFTKRQKIGRTALYRYIKLFEKLSEERNADISDELEILKRMFDSDVVWDEIVGIKYVEPSSQYVYDISVEGLETFTTFDGIITHNTMRTYHFAGTAGIKVTYGLPRLIEIFDAKKEPETPMMTIYLKKEFNSANEATGLAEEMVEKKIVNLIRRISLNLNESSIEIEMLDKRKNDSIGRVIKEGLKELNVKIRGEKIVVTQKTETDIKTLQKIKERILSLQASGIGGISNAIVMKEEGGWIIRTIGSNLEKILAVREVDERKTFTNNIHETARILGIEAARNVIVNEAIKTMQEQALDVDVRYVLLVGDIMTFFGEVNSIGRYGVAGSKTSILARAAFEETIKHLVRASIRNEADNLQGIFENVMIGQVVPSGTGMFDLVAKFEEEKK